MKSQSDPSRASVGAPLPRVATLEEWERGRPARRALSRRISGGKILRRTRGNPRKDRLFRELNNGERGLSLENPEPHHSA